MKKLIIFLVAILTCLVSVFAGCNNTKTGYSNNLSGFNGDPLSNGGSVVVKGEYVYFINGVASYTDDNTYEKPVTGALVRVNKADLAKATAEKSEQNARISAEMVIPSLFVAGDKTSGFYIFGDSVYYATPCTDKNKAGVVQNSKLTFMKTTLNGATSERLISVDDNTTQYRYVESGNTVYLVLKTVKTVTKDGEETTVDVIKIYNATENKEVYTTEKISSVIFTDGGNGAEIYYTRPAYNEKLEEDEAFNEVHRVKLDGTDEMILSGEGLMTSENGVGLTGVTYTLVKDTADTLYVKVTHVDTSITTVTHYAAVAKASLVGTENDKAVLKANYEKLEIINEGSANAGTIFTDASWYQSKDSIVYLDSTHGIIKYEYGTADLADNDYRIRLFYDKDLVGYTAKFWDNGYLYLTDSNGLYYRLNVAALLDETAENDNVEVERITYVASATDWYLPEVVDNYLLTVYNASPYNSLVYVADMAANAQLSDEDIEELTASKEEKVQAILDTSISIYSETVAQNIKDYMEATFTEEE